MMSLAPKKDGGPNTKFFESPETISLFDAIKSWLQKNCKKVRLNGGYIAGWCWLTCIDNRLSPIYVVVSRNVEECNVVVYGTRNEIEILCNKH
jgi:hypothetical protein